MAEQDPLVGRVIHGYRVVSLLGEGGMGKVYLAQQERIGKKIAIKSLKPAIASNQVVVARFFREAESVNKLSHENVVDIFNLVHEPKDNEFFILMEHLEGRTLGAVIQREAPLSLHQIGHISLQICSALAAAHSHGIIHRDLKSENVFLINRAGQKNFVKILDFGLAKLLGGDASAQANLTKEGVPMGSPPYMSPEHVRGAEVDGRSDIYSLGILLYEMATGVRPFMSSKVREILFHQLGTAPTPPSQRNPNIDPQLEALLLRCLEKKKEDRYQSVAELAEALAEACSLELSHYWSHALVSMRGAPRESEHTIFEAEPLSGRDISNAPTLDAGATNNSVIEIGSSELLALSPDEISTDPAVEEVTQRLQPIEHTLLDLPLDDKDQ